MFNNRRRITSDNENKMNAIEILNVRYCNRARIVEVK